MPKVGNSDQNAGFAIVNIVGLFIALAEISVVAMIIYTSLSVNFCLGFISFIALSFATFLFGIAREQGKRSIIAALVFIAVNIACIIITFGIIYSRLGLYDSIRKEQTLPTIWDGIYFSIITLTTVGYGDITPNLQTRSIAAFEAITGYVVMGLLISVLIVIAQRLTGDR